MSGFQYSPGDIDLSGYLSFDFYTAVATGKVEGATSINKFGKNSDIDTGSDPEDVWEGGGIYDFYPTTDQSMEILSSDAADVGNVVSSGTATDGTTTTLIDSSATFITDGVAVCDVVINDSTGEYGLIETVTSETTLTLTRMTNASQIAPASTANASGHTYKVVTQGSTGAAVCHIEGLGSWGLITETVVLNGTTPVNLQKDYNRQFRGSITGPGDATGTITCRIQGGGTTAMVIMNGDNQTQQSMFAIPEGYTGLFVKGYVAISRGGQGDTAAFTWRARPYCGVFQVKGEVEVNNSGSSWWQYDYGVPLLVPERTDLLIRCEEVGVNNTGVVAGIDMVFFKNSIWFS